MSTHVSKVLLGVVGITRSQSLEVLDLPAATIVSFFFPRLVLGDREERDFFLALGDL